MSRRCCGVVELWKFEMIFLISWGVWRDESSQSAAFDELFITRFPINSATTNSLISSLFECLLSAIKVSSFAPLFKWMQAAHLIAQTVRNKGEQSFINNLRLQPKSLNFNVPEFIWAEKKENGISWIIYRQRSSEFRILMPPHRRQLKLEVLTGWFCVFLVGAIKLIAYTNESNFVGQKWSIESP